MIEDEVLAAWIEDLEGFPREAIESAIRRWRREEERRPTPAGLRRLCREEMPKPRIVRNAPEPPRERVTPEAAREILAQTGWSQRLIKRMPRSGEE